jgi:predicted GIY-YIG superfamily endonuclease
MPDQPTPPPERTALYRLYDANGKLLYVGITNDTERRWSDHSSDKSWWPDVTERTVEWFATRPAAEAAEIQAIKTEKPRRNRAHNVSLELGHEYLELMKRQKSLFPRGHSDYGPLADFIQRKIDEGEWLPGEKLPRSGDMMSKFLVSKTTLQRALMVLAQRGVITSKGQHIVNDPRDRTVTIPVGRPESAALLLCEAIPPADLAALVRILNEIHEPDEVAKSLP